MKKLLFLLALLLLCTACGKQQPPAVIAGDAEETEVSYIDLDQPISAQATPETDAVACKTLEKDGKMYGFELRFPKTLDVDEMLRSEQNYYFGVLQNGKKKLAVPMEEIRILPDVTTKELVATLLVPQGEKLSGGKWTVSFYVSAREGSAADALFAAEKEVDIS
ncbi:MAG: hypothetical protein IJT44_04915 [Clostridia bacterium]|nr:hypothetical protein [Clostridia bacterium]